MLRCCSGSSCVVLVFGEKMVREYVACLGLGCRLVVAVVVIVVELCYSYAFNVVLVAMLLLS